jgi:hypothetical protein
MKGERPDMKRFVRKTVFCLDHPEKDLKCERLEKEKLE